MLQKQATIIAGSNGKTEMDSTYLTDLAELAKCRRPLLDLSSADARIREYLKFNTKTSIQYLKVTHVPFNSTCETYDENLIVCNLDNICFVILQTETAFARLTGANLIACRIQRDLDVLHDQVPDGGDGEPHPLLQILCKQCAAV